MVGVEERLLSHSGSAVDWIAPDVLAAPWRRVL